MQNQTDEVLLSHLAESLDSTAKMTQQLLSDLKEGEADFAVMKTELSILKENVKDLSGIIKKEGIGTATILVRIALIEKSVEDFKRWIDKHIDVHQRLKKEHSNFSEKLDEIENRLIKIDRELSSTKRYVEDGIREKQESISREIDIAHEKKKLTQKEKSERKAAITKVIAAILIGLVGLLTGYITKSCDDNSDSNTPTTSAS